MGGKGSGRKLSPCGTWGAYQRHLKNGEIACRACKDAAAQEFRKRNGSKPRRAAKFVNNKTRMKFMRQIVRQAVVLEKMRRGQCLDCGRLCDESNFFAFDFDHRDPADKAFAVSQFGNKEKLEPLHAEMAKCDLVCAYCHRLRTFAAGHEHLGNQPKQAAPTLFDNAS